MTFLAGRAPPSLSLLWLGRRGMGFRGSDAARLSLATACDRTEAASCGVAGREPREGPSCWNGSSEDMALLRWTR